MSNQHLIMWLEKILEDYESNPKKTTYQKRAISNGIYSIKNHDKEITSKKDAIQIKGIGKSLSEKIEVILKTGEYPLEKKQKLEDDISSSNKKSSKEIVNDNIQDIKKNLMKITGIGEKKADVYIKLGIKSREELLDKVLKKEIKVTDHILIGLKYYDDFNERIPRKEVDDFNKYFNSTEILEQYKVDASSLEGYLYPDTYYLYHDSSPEEIIDILLSEFWKKVDESLQDRANQLGFSVHEVVTLASIIEGEAMLDSERSTISSVYHNRLKINMKLQADPTIQ